MDEPTIVNDLADIKRLNALLEQITERPFVSPSVAAQAIRAALDLHGITLPRLGIEHDVQSPDTLVAYSYLQAGKWGGYSTADGANGEVEYLYKIVDFDHDQDIKDGVEFDWDDRLYLYIVMDRHNDVGVWEVYACVCDVDDVDALIYADIPADLEELPAGLGNTDVNGETPYMKQVRHSGTGGFTGEV